ncbi:MAG: hypothetical protein KU29_12635 [Sulfurovum sp. FS06-10]|nr:MAG: hypothetical protein KU29_12635 [Sulfurovum sp. FS06-10]
MAFPIIATIGGWFTSNGAVKKIFDWIGDKFSSKTAILGQQWFTLAALVAARIAFLIAVLEFSRLTLGAFQRFLDNLPSLLSSDVYLSLGYQVMRSIGLIDAFLEAFSLFNVLFVSLLTAWSLKFAYHTAKMTSDELFKIGVLTLQD